MLWNEIYLLIMLVKRMVITRKTCQRILWESSWNFWPDYTQIDMRYLSYNIYNCCIQWLKYNSKSNLQNSVEICKTMLMLNLFIIIGFVLHWLMKPSLGNGGLPLRILSLGLTLLFLLFVWIVGRLHMTH